MLNFSLIGFGLGRNREERSKSILAGRKDISCTVFCRRKVDRVVRQSHMEVSCK